MTIHRPAGLAFIGDIHRQWHHVVRGLAALPEKPEAAILLGDMECDRPLDEVAAPLLDAGIALHWIWGNHDYDGGPEMWTNLTSPVRNPRSGQGTLNARIVTVGGVRIAGLSGTFRRRVWEPPEPPRLRGRAELPADLATLGPEWSEPQRDAMGEALAAMAIWPEDAEALAVARADIIVTHEAPSSHPQGFAAIDAIARSMGARLIVHGHHHVCYRARASDGLEVQGVGAGWAVDPAGIAWWPGEPDRWFGQAAHPWQMV
jgi:predicted phosphodiesterase